MPGDLHEMIAGLQKGDHQAFKTFIRMYRQPAYRISFRILGDQEEALEAIQESFIRIWHRIGTFRAGQSFDAWVNRVFANGAIDRLRALRRHRVVALEEIPEHLLAPDPPDPGTDIDNAEAARLIRAISEGLPEKQRLVFVLRDLEGMASEEVQAVLGLSEDAVKSNLWHARKAVREKISGWMSYERSTP